MTTVSIRQLTLFQGRLGDNRHAGSSWQCCRTQHYRYGHSESTQRGRRGLSFKRGLPSFRGGVTWNFQLSRAGLP